jgi:hypothetical protein
VARKRTRYVPRKIITMLLEHARSRCCVSRELLAPGERRLKKLAKLLNKHHIVFFSAGGATTEDNLVLVCPNCHSLIHDDPDSFTPEKLRALKSHWQQMTKVVPQELVYPLAIRGKRVLLSVPIALETVNLRYQILAPASLPLEELSEFVAARILSPLGKYDHNEDWLSPTKLALALASKPRDIISTSTLLEEVRIEAGDALAVLVQRWVATVMTADNDALQLADSLYDYVASLLSKVGDRDKSGWQGPIRVGNVACSIYSGRCTRILEVKSRDSEIRLEFEVRGWVNVNIDGKKIYDFKHFGRFPGSLAETPDRETGDRTLLHKIAKDVVRDTQPFA